MKFSLSWLKRHLDTNHDAQSLAKAMTAFGAEVESVLSSPLQPQDWIYEINVTPNRPDWAGVRGIARDLAAVGMGTLLPLKYKKVSPTYQSPVALKAANDGSTFCAQFLGRHVRGFKNAESPEWLKNLLKSADFEPHSALVDLTNFLSFDLCRPAHVYHAPELNGAVTTRLSKQGEEFISLGGDKYQLPNGVGLIADTTGPLAVAGVLGGKRGAWQLGASSDAFLEIAYFNPSSVAFAGRVLGISTDARYRFERGVDPAFLSEGMEYLSALIQEICGGEFSEVVSIGNMASVKRSILFSHEAVRKLSGAEVALDLQKKILESLACEVVSSDTEFTVHVPSWRHDLTCPADLVEEIVRTIGYDKVPTLPLPARARDVGTTRASGIVNFSRGIRRGGALARRSLCARGYLETVTFSFLSGASHPEFTRTDRELTVVNPITVELDTLRSSIIPNLVEGAKSNLLRSVKSGSLFEVGPVARAVKGTVVEETNITGMRFGFKSRKNWRAKDAAFDFFDIKADTEAVLSELGLIDLTFAAPKEAVAGFHPARSAVISFAGTPVGMCGQLHPEYCKAHDIGLDAFVFEISLTTVLRLREAGTNPSVRFQPSDLLPVERDLSLLLDTKVEVGAVQKLIATKLGAQFISVNVFDVFEGSKLPEGKRAVGFTMLIRQGSTAFTSAQLDEICRGVIDEVRSKFGAELRQ